MCIRDSPPPPSRRHASPRDLATLDAVRSDATRIFTARLAPAPGEPARGNRDGVEARAEAAEAEGLLRKPPGAPAASPTRSPKRESARASGDLRGGGGGSRAAYAPRGSASGALPPRSLSEVDDALADKEREVERESRDLASKTTTAAAPRGGPLPVALEALHAEVRRCAKAYVARREAEFWRDASRRKADLVAAETARRRRAVDPEGTSDLAFLSHVSADKLRETARRNAQRALNNELLEARLDAWPLWRVLREVEAGFRDALRAFADAGKADEIYITPEAEAEAAATYEVRAEENVRAAEAERDDAQRRAAAEAEEEEQKEKEKEKEDKEEEKEEKEKETEEEEKLSLIHI